jgi:hypothetical protein
MCFLILALAGVALAVVFLRAEQTRCAARTLAMESRRIELRSELWALQTRAARLRAPHQIRDRVGRLEAAVAAPDSSDALRGPTRLAVDRGD